MLVPEEFGNGAIPQKEANLRTSLNLVKALVYTIKNKVVCEPTPLILIITKDNQKIYYSSKDKNNDEIYKELKSKIIEE